MPSLNLFFRVLFFLVSFLSFCGILLLDKLFILVLDLILLEASSIAVDEAFLFSLTSTSTSTISILGNNLYPSKAYPSFAKSFCTFTKSTLYCKVLSHLYFGLFLLARYPASTN